MCEIRKSILLLLSCFAVPLVALAQSSGSAAVQPSRFVLYESFAGDTNADGQVMALNSSATYYLTDHFSVRAGIPIYFDHIGSLSPAGPTAVPTSTFSSGIGDIFLSVRAAWKQPILNYATAVMGTAPTGEVSKGFSTGHFTFDWSNRFDHSFGPLRPYVNVGLANSVTDTPYFMRPFATFGPLAHFEGGAEITVVRGVSVAFTGYDIAPWGMQTLVSRVVAAGPASKVGNGSHGRTFDTGHQTTGAAALTHDDGASANLVVSPTSYLDLSVGYARSAQYALNTISFGIGVNVTALFSKGLRP